VTKRVGYILLLAAYAALLIKVMVLKDVPLVRVGHLMLNFGGSREGNANLVPFKTILPYLMGDKGWIIAGINLAGNVLLLVPVGFLLPLAFPVIGWKLALPLSFFAGLLIEGLQVLLRVGIFDIDDVILNGGGVMMGYGILMMLSALMRSMTPQKRTIASVSALASIGLFWVVAFSPIGMLPVSLGPAPANGLQGPLPELQNNNTSCCDLCGGTGGTGEIIELGEQTITIKRKDGVIQRIGVGKQTTIKNSAGPATAGDLKKGDHVTVIIGLIKEDSMMASAILVCQVLSPRSVK
jgi:glycopeptide antibiotics resistance protein